MDPNTPRSPKRASEGPYRLRKRIKAVQYADNPARKESNKKRVPGVRQQRQQIIWEHDETCQLLAHLQWSFNNGVDFWTTAFPKFQDTVQQAFTNDQAKKQLQHISSQHGQMEGDDDYPNLLESGLDSLNLPEDISRNVDQFLNRIPDISADDTRAKCCLKRLLVTFLVSPKKLKDILPNEEGAKTTGLVDQGSSVDPDQLKAEQQPSQASSPLGSTNQLVGNSSAKRGEASVERGFVDYLPPNRREMVEIETRLIASLIETERLKREVAQYYQPNARVLLTLQQYMESSHLRVRRNRIFNANSPAPDEQASRSDLVESWALNIFKRNLKDCISQVRESKISKDNLLLGLVGSAVIEMIFEPAFPAFIQAPNPVAEAYRELILDISGPNELHEADSNVLPQLLKQHQPEIIKRKVYELDHGENGNKEEAPRQNDVFSLFLIWALQFKIDLISTTTRLKFFYYKTDEVFDDTRMERSGEESQTSKDYVLEHNTNYSI
ncbi:uncharacterized protein FFUJ_09417 [Fusarium fujikuroi IMI 58289]|uniref:Uncharacterized protein n=1 Tax=Gibberella fujikuroi (strain CBS 195.34 / IMI 58289 / NRRL A-6831) TaxID=1279085 RepID=S0EH97_GIBF5|nr:uncharacterized protein FFUJ_09417 [Fusarium fujikuroi IMI 58289]CCT74149.1 uncharacterized protein FFUJ_09417 [Fusarium fujikuroi IMI 58289]